MAILIPAAIFVIIASALTAYLVNAHRLKTTYAQAAAYMETGQYQEAIDTFSKIPDYEDSARLKAEAELAYAYQQALSAIEQKNYSDAIDILKDLSYRDSQELYIDTCYQYGMECFDAGSYRTARKMFETCRDYQYAADMLVLLDIFDLCDNDRYTDAVAKLQTLSAEYISENQESYNESYAACVWDAIEKQYLSLEYALVLLESLPEPYKTDAAYTIELFNKLIPYSGKFQQEEDLYGPYYLTVSFITYGEEIGAVIDYTNYTGTIAVGTTGWNFDLNEDGEPHEFPVRIEAKGVNSSHSFTFYLGLEKAKVVNFGPYTFFRIE